MQHKRGINKQQSKDFLENKLTSISKAKRCTPLADLEGDEIEEYQESLEETKSLIDTIEEDEAIKKKKQHHVRKIIKPMT